MESSFLTRRPRTLRHSSSSPPTNYFDGKKDTYGPNREESTKSIRITEKYFHYDEEDKQEDMANNGNNKILVSREDLAYTSGPPLTWNRNSYVPPAPLPKSPSSVDIPSQIPNGTSQGEVVIRGEEVGIVLVVLVLWVAAIILFFNRWGKIRMLEPYQPKFCEHHNPNCPMSDPIIPPVSLGQTRTFSKFNLLSDLPTTSPHFSKCNYHGVTTTIPSGENPNEFNMSGISTSLGVPASLNLLGGPASPRISSRSTNSMMNRPRQNSVFVTSPNYSGKNIFGSSQQLSNDSRKTKSAVDLSTLVLSGEFMDNVRRNSKNSITNL